jgi:large subunit ribosomal protein L24
MEKLKVGDTVQVIAGAERSETPETKRGKVLKIDRDAQRVTVEGVRLVKRHLRKTPQQPEGGIVEKPGTIHISDVQVVCAKCDKPTRVGIRADGEKKKRFCKNCDALID